MKRQLNLRQVEAFKAVFEQGSVSRAAEILFVTQPAASKLVAHLEEDTGLTLFERVRGKLVPTRHGVRLYAEVDRVFAGLRQVEQAVDSIRRDEERHLSVGVLPALSGFFLTSVTMNFLKKFPNVQVSIVSLSSPILADRMVTRQLDVGLVNGMIDNPYVEREPLMEQPLVCVLPPTHPLCKKTLIRPHDLDAVPFVTFSSDVHARRLIESTFEKYSQHLYTVLETSTAPSVCEFVAAGLGVALIHPLFASGMRDRVVIRPFEPEVNFYFQLCRMQSSRNPALVDAYLHEVRLMASQISREMLSSP
ncbi:LysR family transcriptional regulator [Caballeronia mineralivorans PML1(12)]|uniref:LysR family transcriptional regulator n=1 Tax=Caballeronia mineralivorans PML1(12) TaxID=908627 RepID=A0A0J1CNC4_9BURK|nr:LysR substrate-binding domain-containing protein [Caballeronia mineralivorans]KLU21906.1 LysR family transcriptional regulator [Caballeronia mineralivorans PML1(12)]